MPEEDDDEEGDEEDEDVEEEDEREDEGVEGSGGSNAVPAELFATGDRLPWRKAGQKRRLELDRQERGHARPKNTGRTRWS